MRGRGWFILKMPLALAQILQSKSFYIVFLPHNLWKKGRGREEDLEGGEGKGGKGKEGKREVGINRGEGEGKKERETKREGEQERKPIMAQWLWKNPTEMFNKANVVSLSPTGLLTFESPTPRAIKQANPQFIRDDFNRWLISQPVNDALFSQRPRQMLNYNEVSTATDKRQWNLNHPCHSFKLLQVFFWR